MTANQQINPLKQLAENPIDNQFFVYTFYSVSAYVVARKHTNLLTYTPTMQNSVDD